MPPPSAVPSLLRDKLHTLDIPADGSVRLVSLAIDTDPRDGATTWTVVFKEKAAAVAAGGGGEPAAEVMARPPSNATTENRSPLLLPQAIAKPPEVQPKPEKPRYPLRAPTTLSFSRMLTMRCEAKTYAWGKLGKDSLVAQLAEAGVSGLEINKAAPYAALWMGTRPPCGVVRIFTP